MLRILIADDHEVARRGIRALLESHPGWEVCAEAKDGRETVDLAARLKPDLILLDIGMPNLNGLDLLKKLRATAKFVSLPIIMVTSEAAKYNVIEAVKAGVNDYLVKPVTEKSLEEKIRRVLDRKPS